ncbi:Hsp20/alpha crystallin family protein [Bordetella sp. H567]|uniref:Hsp20/alpha crystallin family protein n=1 Tax=Bordetella sp. H567 TaxID=1697043 RepID=UPI001F3F14B7|nr:Hsp20/alpha crystallin family protein [Bordetella sp. H567]
MSLHREVNRLFDDLFRNFDIGLPTARAFSRWPNIEVAEEGQTVRVTAELPGMEEKDVEILLEEGTLTLRGEKRAESRDNARQFSERFYGRFERVIPIGHDIDEGQVKASFENGVLTVTLPKTESAQSRVKRIPVNG